MVGTRFHLAKVEVCWLGSHGIYDPFLICNNQSIPRPSLAVDAGEIGMGDFMRFTCSLALCAALASCGPVPQSPQPSASDAVTPQTVPTGAANLARSHVTRADFESRGLKWPLTVDAGELGCTDLSRWVRVNGKQYGLNGTAQGHGYSDIEPIWRPDEAMAQALKAAGGTDEPPTKVSIGDMISEAGKYC